MAQASRFTAIGVSPGSGWRCLKNEMHTSSSCRFGGRGDSLTKTERGMYCLGCNFQGSLRGRDGRERGPNRTTQAAPSNALQASKKQAGQDVQVLFSLLSSLSLSLSQTKTQKDLPATRNRDTRRMMRAQGGCGDGNAGSRGRGQWSPVGSGDEFKSRAFGRVGREQRITPNVPTGGRALRAAKLPR